MWYIGTSGFSFEDWIGTVYPSDTRREEMFTYYCQVYKFNAVELNFTFYQMPSWKTILRLLRKSLPGFKFSVKVHGSITHEGNLDNISPFLENTKILAEEGKMIGYLAQFPYSFKKSPENEEFLFRLAERISPLFVEFRHDSWVEFCEKHSEQFSFVAVDLPKIANLFPFLVFNKGTVYVRFHGRNKNWFQADEKTRYDYDYSENELTEFVSVLNVPWIQTRYVFFNNCYRGQALRNALKFREMVGGSRAGDLFSI
ncbi:DUF72 domain-containing protein [Fervidobacterium thailandense]|uniref:DUF72 domain-containing protein n=1 Tax=Fervidobacterium thailandense TaxID=1008305 RepID=A0A1E3G2G5_9BACT|nr:DUF72 domain-containing protein [Fervidobacterium thailandense]ODN30474.1 hypothetical protein A4H02_05450 [Fervidobacterium thailandense]